MRKSCGAKTRAQGMSMMFKPKPETQVQPGVHREYSRKEMVKHNTDKALQMTMLAAFAAAMP